MNKILRYILLMFFVTQFLFYADCKKKEIPTLTTSEITNITGNSANCGGKITDEGSGTVIERGICWSTEIDPTINNNKTSDGAGAGNFISRMTGLIRGTTYFVRAYATNKAGTGYGMTMSFLTWGKKPSKNINLDDLHQQLLKDNYAVPEDYTIFEKALQDPTNAKAVYDQLLKDNYAIPSDYNEFLYIFGLKRKEAGDYGLPTAKVFKDMFTFYDKGKIKPPLESNILDDPIVIKDIDGNIYQTVTIGTQVWMAENLKTTKFNDGTPIPLVTDESEWRHLSKPAYCWYNNDAAKYKSLYGPLYNWYTVGTEELCPIGWHLPSDSEWITLATYLGGDHVDSKYLKDSITNLISWTVEHYTVVGGKLKEVGTTYWQKPNTKATNESGFSALPGGYRDLFGPFYWVGHSGSWWSATSPDNKNPYQATASQWGVSCNSDDLYVHYAEKQMGFSVRCVKDN